MKLNLPAIINIVCALSTLSIGLLSLYEKGFQSEQILWAVLTMFFIGTAGLAKRIWPNKARTRKEREGGFR